MNERLTVRRWWWVWNFEKEERWLNEMSLQGWALERVGWITFHFVRCEPGEYTVRLEMRGADDSYVSFMSETGAEYIGRVVQWIYFRRKSELGAFDIFSDLDSRIRHLDRIAKMLGVIGAANIVLGVINSVNRLSILNLLCGCLLMYALGRIHGKAEQLKLERALHE